MHKIRGQSYFFKHATSDQSDKTVLLASKTLSSRIVSSCPGALYTCMKSNKISYKIMRQKGSFLNQYKIIGLIKALTEMLPELVPSGCMPMPWCFFFFFFFSNDDSGHFYDRVKFVPDASI